MTAKDIILQNLIKAMEAGKLNWRKPWGGGNLPQNFVSKRPYSGVNLLITMYSEFTSPYYLSFKQIQDLGGQILKGSHATQLVFWKVNKYASKDSEGNPVEKKGFLLRYYNVWNADQITGINFPKPAERPDMADMSEIVGLADKIHVTLKHREGNEAFYTPATDTITLPLQTQFKSDEGYAQVLLHELVHSTGHSTRLDRLKQNKEQHSTYTEAYSYEELVAELGQSFLCAEYNVQPDIHNSAAYLQGWLERIKKEPDILMKAAGAAQKAVNYITQTVGETEPDNSNVIL